MQNCRNGIKSEVYMRLQLLDANEAWHVFK